MLVTGRIQWVDPDDDYCVTESYRCWRTAWAIAGIHSHNWWWVRKFGARDCGCTINPVTRRRILTRWGCPTHCDIANDEWPEGEEWPDEWV